MAEKDWMDAGLKVPSLINLGRIYKVKSVGDVKGGLHPRIYKEVINKLNKYQENRQDEVFEQIKDKL